MFIFAFLIAAIVGGLISLLVWVFGPLLLLLIPLMILALPWLVYDSWREKHPRSTAAIARRDARRKARREARAAKAHDQMVANLVAAGRYPNAEAYEEAEAARRAKYADQVSVREQVGEHLANGVERTARWASRLMR